MVSPSQTRPVGESHQSGIFATFMPLCHPDLIAAISYLIHWLRLWLQCNMGALTLHLKGTWIAVNLPEAILTTLPLARTLTVLMPLLTAFIRAQSPKFLSVVFQVNITAPTRGTNNTDQWFTQGGWL